MAAKETLTLEIVTPDGAGLTEQVTEFTAPSVDGEFGVLPGHRPMLAALAAGIVSFTTEAGSERVAVGPGFVEVQHGGARVLTDRFARKSDIDAVETRLALKDADEKLRTFTGELGSVEHLEIVADELWAAARLELYGDPPPARTRAYSEVSEGEEFGVVRDD
jgi:F-type H+-transporting ATPase subunit epsilon